MVNYFQSLRVNGDFMCHVGDSLSRGLLTLIEDSIKEITRHKLRVFIEGQCH